MAAKSIPMPRIGFAPPSYLCRRTDEPITIDGNIDKPIWATAPWSTDFVDIEGPENRPKPAQRTRMKMLWDDTYLYLAAELIEHRIWATITRRDAVIFWDNDFEIFFDPTGSTHAYGEIEFNALGTVWDLMLTKPYRDGGIPVSAFDVKGLKLGIHIDGRLNDPDARSQRWCAELAIPWASLYMDADRTHHPIGAPNAGDFWRMNFSRVEWRTEVVDGTIRKVINPATGTSYPEDNWVWAPTGLINIHYPELWGCVHFVNTPEDAPAALIPHSERVKWALRLLYYRQHAFRAEHGHFTGDFAHLRGDDAWAVTPRLGVTRDLFQATLDVPGGDWSIREDGLVWFTPKE